MPVKLRSLEAQRYFIFKPMSRLKLSERTQLFSSPTCPKFYEIDIDKITELLFRKHDIFTTRGERSTYLFERADKNDVMVTRFSKMAVLLFTKGSFLYYEHQVWFNLKFRGKIYFVIIFMSKLRGPVHGLSYLQVSCAFGVLHIYFKLYLIWMTDNK